MSGVIPQLSVRRGEAAIEFYEAAFGAVVAYRVGGGEDGVVAQLTLAGSSFWLSDEAPEFGNLSPETVGGATTRLLLWVEDPRTLFDRAVAAGAREVWPITEEYGWILGRIEDPFGHHWEIGHPLGEWPPSP